MILRLFNDLEAQLSRLRLVNGDFTFYRDAAPGSPAFNLISLWNENTARLTQSRPFSPPAIFIEFLPATWQQLARGSVAADFTIRFHVVTSTLADTDSQYRYAALSRFRLLRALNRCLVNFSGAADDAGRSFSSFKHVGSITDHNHDQITEDIEEWQTHVIDCSASADSSLVLTPFNVDLGEIS